MHVKSIDYTPAYIYLIAAILALPPTWLLVGRSGEDVHDMIAMVVGIILTGVIAFGLDLLRRSIPKRRGQ